MLFVKAKCECLLTTGIVYVTCPDDLAMLIVNLKCECWLTTVIVYVDYPGIFLLI